MTSVAASFTANPISSNAAKTRARSILFNFISRRELGFSVANTSENSSNNDVISGQWASSSSPSINSSTSSSVIRQSQSLPQQYQQCQPERILTIHLSNRRCYSSLSSSMNLRVARPAFALANNTFVKFRLDGRRGISLTTRRQFSSAGKRDFYDVLGVSKGSDKGTVKKAYFQLAKKYHPDTNQGDEKAAEKFKEVTEAYEVLSDDKQRELYDTYGHAGVDPNSGFGNGGGPGGNPFGGAGGFNFNDGSFHFSSSGGGMGGEIDPEELFDAFFGGGRRRPRGPRRGADLQMHVRLSFREAVFGSSQDLNLRYQVRDAQTGQVEIKEREVKVETPAGIDSGMNLRLSGQGAEGDPGAPRGNLLVTVIVEDDEDGYFHRDGADVHVEIPISITQAILGGTVDVRTLNGEVEMKIPKGCQPDSKLLMRGKGIHYLNSREKGNQIVHLKVQIPKKINAKQEELLREFDKETEESGMGVSGRLAKAAGSAFESFFGGKKDKKESSKKDEETVSSENSKSKDAGNDQDVEDKKQHAQ